MNKVTTINLNGNAYQLEEAGYEQLKKYLDSAKKKLADDPDRDEILADFERAIAEKCAILLRPRKNVITEKEIHKIIEDMGPVEPAEGDDQKNDDTPKETDAKTEDRPPKRLYTLREGAIIGGVANGLAAYFNIDVTIVRLLFVLLVLVSGGFWILIYLLIMVVIPEAQTPEQKAELRGERFSAQHVLDRAKHKYADVSSKAHWQNVAERQRPALSNLGNALEKLVRLAMIVVGAGCGVLVGVLTAAWVSGLWWLAFGHPHFADQLSSISHWTVVAGATAAYFVAAVPLGVLTNTFVRVGAGRPFGKQSVRWLGALASLWVVALGVLIGVIAVTGGRVSQYQSTHGELDFGSHHICINQDLCGSMPYYLLPPKPLYPTPMPIKPGLPQ